jgi:hypothetical protein
MLTVYFYSHTYPLSLREVENMFPIIVTKELKESCYFLYLLNTVLHDCSYLIAFDGQLLLLYIQ